MGSHEITIDILTLVIPMCII